jgi:hypothetical protein
MKKRLAALALVFAMAAQAGNRDAHPPKQPDVTARYLSRDFAPLLVPRSLFIGFIGSDFQRLKIHFASVTKDAANPRLYHLTGTSEVKANRCALDGSITVTRLTGAKTGIIRDEDGKDVGVRFEGSLYGRYEIKENGLAAVCGAFRGTLQLDWAIDRTGTLVIDDVDAVSDGYGNNQYEGTWSLGSKSKTANWGEYRVPASQGLDCGAGEFAPCDSYNDKGWADYRPQKWVP